MKIARIIIDTLMLIALLMLMTYELISQAFHEITGCVMFALFISHNILNYKFYANLFKGKYTAERAVQAITNVLILFSMLGSMISGIILSQTVFAALDLSGAAWARVAHLLCAYWGFVLMSLHLGFHLGIFARLIYKKSPKKPVKIICRIVAALLAAYGIFAFVSRDIWSYMFLIYHFVFFDFEEPIMLFIFDYTAIMCLFVFVGFYFRKLLHKIGSHKK